MQHRGLNVCPLGSPDALCSLQQCWVEVWEAPAVGVLSLRALQGGWQAGWAWVGLWNSTLDAPPPWRCKAREEEPLLDGRRARLCSVLSPREKGIICQQSVTAQA